jgi:small subunit ribosomal protein S5
VESSAALVIAGNRNGCAGWGYGKGQDAQSALKKAFHNVWKNLLYMPRHEGRTFPDKATGRCNGCIVKVHPSSRDNGYTAGPFMRAVFDCFGVRDGR